MVILYMMGTHVGRLCIIHDGGEVGDIGLVNKEIK